VKKSRTGVWYKSYSLSILILFMIIGAIVSYSHGEEEKRTSWGFSILGGTGDAVYTKTHVREYGFLPVLRCPSAGIGSIGI